MARRLPRSHGDEIMHGSIDQMNTTIPSLEGVPDVEDEMKDESAAQAAKGQGAE